MRSATDDVLAEWDLRTDEMVWSPNVVEVLGYDAAELASIHQTTAHAVGDEGERVLGDVRRVIAEGGSTWRGTVRWLLPSADTILLELQGNVLRDATGQPVRMVGSARRMRGRTAAMRVENADAPTLTHRQREVLGLVRLGYTNKEIATRLRVSEQAAKVQVSKLLKKFGAKSRAELAVIAREAELSE